MKTGEVEVCPSEPPRSDVALYTTFGLEFDPLAPGGSEFHRARSREVK